jgi:hypothetical protein
LSLLDNYEKFLEEFDNLLEKMFEQQKQYIKCKKGCSICCEQGDYPFSQLEFTYLTEGFIKLPNETKIIVQKNILELLQQKKVYTGERFEHKCPFLINGECCVYKYRGIICRTFGLCYYDDTKDYVRLPGCVHNGLNYAEVYDEKTQTLGIETVSGMNLRIDKVLESQTAQKYGFDHGEIRPMLELFGK